MHQIINDGVMIRIFNGVHFKLLHEHDWETNGIEDFCKGHVSDEMV